MKLQQVLYVGILFLLSQEGWVAGLPEQQYFIGSR